ncbi:Mur ligase family protein [Desulfotomaculum copahuensis]|uniref:Mur ligase family protein n=1 Tax=Desulfotomaculum copahuensis TaxID=1838280 RepID=UPI001FA7EBA0|nr:Mur ligase family protein [Desulfotomaculum copahuensis]
MWLVRVLGRGKGSSLPGMVALKLDPQILRRLARQPRRGVLMTTGTNGKTTTNNMIARVVSAAGYSTVVNTEGANLITGVTAAFLKRATVTGRVDCDYALLEVDEASFPRVTRQVRPGIVVITNFFRDQLDRYGELDKTITLIKDALQDMPGDGSYPGQLDQSSLAGNGLFADGPLSGQPGPAVTDASGNATRTGKDGPGAALPAAGAGTDEPSGAVHRDGRESTVPVEGIPCPAATRLVLNADDPLVAQFAQTTGLTAVYYGLGAHAGVSRQAAAAREAKFCPRCGSELVYAYYHYSQLGNYHCPGCGFTRPEAAVEGLEAHAAGTAGACRIRFPGGGRSLVIPVHGLYNLYNGLAAFTAGLLLGIDPDTIIAALGAYTPATGRMERFNYRGKKTVLLNLVKNPTGFNEGLAALLAMDGPVDVLIAINDNDADGRDISWLWDVDFEVLEEGHRPVAQFVCTGLRGAEMGVRLKYAGVPVDKIRVCDSLTDAVRLVLDGPGRAACLLATYTALWPVERILSGYAEREQKHVANLPSVS